MSNLTKEEITNILNDTFKDDSKCVLRGTKKYRELCENCKFHKDGKCTFNIWKWKGIGG